MPILRKGDRAVHFAHVPRTGGRSIIQAAVHNGWSVERFIESDRRVIKSHLFYSEISGTADRLVSFAVVRDPVDRFISATKYLGRCQSQSDVVDLLHHQDAYPDVEERHFHPQGLFISEHTILFKYETELPMLVNSLKIADIIRKDYEPLRINDGAVIFDVNKEEIKRDLAKVRRWYMEDYKRFEYIGTKA